MITRRNFLTGTAATAALLATHGSFAWAAKSKRKRRYLVTTVSPYWNKTQDFTVFGELKKIPLPDGFKIEDYRGFRTALTMVDEDGGNLQRRIVDGGFHSATSSADGKIIYLQGSTRPSRLLALDSETLEVVSSLAAKPDEPWLLSGHGTPVPGTDAVAFGINNIDKIGRYGTISFRDPHTLKEVHRFSTYGFNLHEIVLSADKKSIVCAHYGSYYGGNIYDKLKVYGGYNNHHPEPPKSGIIYPGSVVMVDLKSGKRNLLMSDVEGGEHGHVTSDEQNRAYLACERAMLKNREGVEQNPKFLEGELHQPDGGEFALKMHALGVAVTYDRKFHEVLVPRRGSLEIVVTDTKTQNSRTVNLLEQVGWEQPKEDFTHGIAIHPDGEHYVLSTSNGFVGVRLGKHTVNKKMVIPVPLKIHSHLHIV